MKIYFRYVPWRTHCWAGCWITRLTPPLQCAIPTFEGLLQDAHGERVLDLLFVFAYWHSFAKLRLHTDRTLQILDTWTSVLGHECRRFSAETCEVIQTYELQREYRARKRNEARKKAAKKSQPTQVIPLPDDTLVGPEPASETTGRGRMSHWFQVSSD